jgi:hypothetical protein
MALASSALLAAPQVDSSPAAEPASLAELTAAVNNKLDVSTSTLQEVTWHTDAEGGVTTAVVLDGVEMTLELVPHSLRSPDFQLLAQIEEGGPLVPREIPPFHTLKGAVQGRPDLMVRASLDAHGLTAMIFTPDGPHAIEPVAGLKLAAPASLHVVYNSRDWLNSPGLHCGAEGNGPLGALKSSGSEGAGQRGAAGLNLEITEIGIDSDSFFYFDEGGNDAEVLAQIESDMNLVEGIYEQSDVGITYEVTTVILRTVPGPYANPGDIFNLLNTFGATWNAVPQNSIKRDIAQLFSGQSLSGSIIGVADLSVICDQNDGYSVVENLSSSASQAALNAHELGHNWSAPHCDAAPVCRIMCSGLGGCDGLSPLTFGPSEAATISNFKNSLGCLHDLPPPLELPFCEEFGASLDPAKWIYINGATATASASNPPSGPWALRLNAAGSNEFQDDDLRTNFIDLAGQFNVELTFFTEHVGVGAGEELVIEFWHISDKWQELDRITSDGVDQTQFEFHSYVLPITSAHNEFRVRFRPEVSGSNDNWYIDNVGLDCFCDDPCSDGNPCTVADSCDGIICSGNNVNCAPFDQECNTASCDIFGSNGNCAILTPANEGNVCGGGTGICTEGTCQNMANTARTFMALDGNENTAAAVGPTAMAMGQGTTATVGIFLDDNSPPGTLLNAYQLMMNINATPLAGATGSVFYIDNSPGSPGGNSIFIDTARSDWLYTGQPVLPINYNETPGLGIFGVFYSTVPGTGVDPAALGGIRYLAEFQLAASPTALGQFRLQFNATQPPLTTLFTPTGAQFPVEQLQSLIVTVVQQGNDCVNIADCADVDQNNIRDDGCVWWSCFVGTCQGTDVVFADMGGQFGACPPDGAADGNDRFHALNCFSDQNTANQPGYPCEDSPPQAFNVDAGGQFGSCNPDGVCDGNDAFHALNAFAGSTPCTCSGPAPQWDPETTGRSALTLRARGGAALPGGTVAVDVYLRDGVEDLRGYQLHLGVRGGDQGSLELMDIAVEPRPGQPFNGLGAWQAFNVRTAQMVAGLDSAGVPAEAGAYLATFIYQASKDASGTFTVELLHDDADTTQRTFLFPTPANGRIEVTAAEAATVSFAQGRRMARTDRK